MELNDVTYGNPTVQDLTYMQGECLVEDLFETLKNTLVYPRNDSELVKDELNEIMDCLETMGQT